MLMSISEAIGIMTLSDLVILRESLNNLMGQARRRILNDRVRDRGMIGLRMPVKKGRGRSTKVVRIVEVNAEVLEYDKGILKVEVIEPDEFATRVIEVSEELVYEPFALPQEEEV